MPAREEGGPGRVFIKGMPWHVIAMTKSKLTKLDINPVKLLQVRLDYVAPSTVTLNYETAGKRISDIVPIKEPVDVVKPQTTLLKRTKRITSIASLTKRKRWQVSHLTYTVNARRRSCEDRLAHGHHGHGAANINVIGSYSVCAKAKHTRPTFHAQDQTWIKDHVAPFSAVTTDMTRPLV